MYNVYRWLCLPAVSASLMLASCGNHTATNQTTPVDSTAAAAKDSAETQDLCFLSVSGQQNEDSLSVTLHINGSEVTGIMKDVVFKETRSGLVQGVKGGDSIRAVWQYAAGGKTDSLLLNLKINAAGLQQQVVTKEGGAGSPWITIPAVDCAGGTAAANEFTAAGVLSNIVNGKDGYMATLTTDKGVVYNTMFSVIKLEKAYKRLKAGDKAEVSGDTLTVGSNLQIQVKHFSVQ